MLPTVSDFSSFAEIMLHNKSFGLRILGVGVDAVCDNDTLIRYPSFPKVLRLSSALVSEATSSMNIPFMQTTEMPHPRNTIVLSLRMSRSASES